jgi:hypothetical protein
MLNRLVQRLHQNVHLVFELRPVRLDKLLLMCDLPVGTVGPFVASPLL